MTRFQYLQRLRMYQTRFGIRSTRGLRMGRIRTHISSAHENAKKRGIMPISNPTGNPFARTIKIPDDDEALKKLQVKVDLFKIGDPPRVYSEHIKD